MALVVEGVGGQKIGNPAFDVGVADLTDDLGSRQVQKVVVALLVVREVAAAAVAGLIEAMGLDRGAVRPVLHQDAFLARARAAGRLFQCESWRRTPKRWQVAKVRSARLSV